MVKNIEYMDFDERVKVGNCLAKVIVPGRWEESSEGNVFKNGCKGIHVRFSPRDFQRPESYCDTVTVTYLSAGLGDAYHLFDHYQSLFGGCCDVFLRGFSCFREG